MILNICYNNSCTEFLEEILKFCQEFFPNIELKSFNEDDYKERKKAFKVKGGYSARMTPFMLLTTKDNTYIKAFYSEDQGCTLKQLQEILNLNK